MESKTMTGGQPLTPELKHLVTIVAFCSLGRSYGTAHAIELALGGGVSPKRIAEAVLQTYLFAGYPRSINGLGLLRTILETKGVTPSWEEHELEELEQGELEGKGLSLFRAVYANKSDDLRASIEKAHPLMARWMIREGYGRVLSRPLLTKVERELLALASLVALGVSPQVRAHIGGAFNLGATKKEIAETIYAAGEISPVPDLELYLKWAGNL